MKMLFISFLFIFFSSEHVSGVNIISNVNEKQVVDNKKSKTKNEEPIIQHYYHDEITNRAVEIEQDDFDKFLFENDPDVTEYHGIKVSKINAVVMLPPHRAEITKISVERLKFNKFFVDHLINNGNLRLEKIAYLIKNRLNVTTDIERILHNVTNNFAIKLKKHSRFLNNLNLTNDLDKELMYFDLIETTYKLLFHNSVAFLNKTIEENKLNIKHVDNEMFLQEIKQQALEEKSIQMKFICRAVSICRPFPSYTDHVIRFVDLILGTPDEKFEQVINLFRKLVKRDIDHFKLMMRPETYEAIGSQLQTIFQNINTTRAYLSIISKVIANSFKVFHMSENYVLKKTKAVRILIDLIDKTFDKMGDDMIEMEFNTIKEIVEQWAGGFRHQIEESLEFYFESIIGNIKYNIDATTKEEFKVLFDVLMTGTTVDLETYEYLFTKGSLCMTGPDHYEYELGL